MNTLFWVLQAIIAAAFLYSGICKSVFSEKKLVKDIGQTGVEGLPLPVIRGIGLIEILGSIGILLPQALSVYVVLVPVSAIGFAGIMVPAAIIHYKRKEPKNVFTNVFLFLLCGVVAYGRMN